MKTISHRSSQDRLLKHLFDKRISAEPLAAPDRRYEEARMNARNHLKFTTIGKSKSRPVLPPPIVDRFDYSKTVLGRQDI